MAISGLAGGSANAEAAGITAAGGGNIDVMGTTVAMSNSSLDTSNASGVAVPDELADYDAIVFGTASTATGLMRVAVAGGDVTVLTRPDRAQGEALAWKRRDGGRIARMAHSGRPCAAAQRRGGSSDEERSGA